MRLTYYQAQARLTQTPERLANRAPEARRGGNKSDLLGERGYILSRAFLFYVLQIDLNRTSAEYRNALITAPYPSFAPKIERMVSGYFVTPWPVENRRGIRKKIE